MLIVKKYAVTMLPSHKTRQLAPSNSSIHPLPLLPSLLPSSLPPSASFFFFKWINLLFYVYVSCIRAIDVYYSSSIMRVRPHSFLYVCVK